MILGLKKLSENLSSFKNSNNDNNNGNSYTIKQIDENLTTYYNKMKTIKEQVEDIKSQWKSLQEDVECFSFAKAVYQGASIREGFQKAIDDLKLEFEDAKTNFTFYKNLKNKVLTEAESIEPIDDYSKEELPITINSHTTYSEDSINNDDNDVDYNYIIDELSSMVKDSGNSTEDILQYLFDELVPEDGKSDTFAGELVRAIMHLMYNALQNKYFFFEGDGLDVCGSSAQFLKDNGYSDDFSIILDNIYEVDYPTYKEWLISLANKIINDIYENPEYLSKQNSINSRQYNYQEIIDIEPIREYVVEIPEKITELYDDYFNVYDILRYLKETFDEDGITEYTVDDIFDSKSKTISINDIKGATLNYFVGLFEDSKFWDDYYNELTSDLEEDLQIIHNTLNETLNEYNSLVDIFMQYHEDSSNYHNNPEGYDSVYAILDKYGSEDEDVDEVFLRASEDEQKEMIDLIRPRDEYLN